MSDRSGSAIDRRVLLVSCCLLGLTAAAVFTPRLPSWRGDGSLLVLLPAADARRGEALDDLAAYLGRHSQLRLHVKIVPDRAAFVDALPEALLTLSPDGVALSLPSSSWQALATGRRRAPWNQRPMPVLVSRRDGSAIDRPWRTAPARTVFGDSLSFVCLAPLCEDGMAAPPPGGPGWGLDPYDHRGVLAAAAHGAYDHAIVREWDAVAALAAGQLDPAQWYVRPLGEPVPDVVVFASRRLAGTVRLDLQEALTLLGRDDVDLAPADRLAQVQLGLFGLDGFNLLLGPDIERLRRLHERCRPHRQR